MWSFRLAGRTTNPFSFAQTDRPVNPFRIVFRLSMLIRFGLTGRIWVNEFRILLSLNSTGQSKPDPIDTPISHFGPKSKQGLKKLMKTLCAVPLCQLVKVKITSCEDTIWWVSSYILLHWKLRMCTCWTSFGFTFLAILKDSKPQSLTLHLAAFLHKVKWKYSNSNFNLYLLTYLHVIWGDLWKMKERRKRKINHWGWTKWKANMITDFFSFLHYLFYFLFLFFLYSWLIFVLSSFFLFW